MVPIPGPAAAAGVTRCRAEMGRERAGVTAHCTATGVELVDVFWIAGDLMDCRGWNMQWNGTIKVLLVL